MRTHSGANILTPQVITANVNGSGVDRSDYKGNGYLSLNTSAPTGTLATLDVKIQHSDDNSTWTDSGFAFDQVVQANGASFQRKYVSLDQFKKFIRAAATVGGTSPSVVATVTMSGQRSSYAA